MNNPNHEFSTETPKLAFDLYKNLITLDTGAIVLIATFLNFFKQPEKLLEWKGAIVLCLCFFGLSIIGCLIILLSLVIDVRMKGRFGHTKKQERYLVIGMLCAWGGYLIGLASLIAFIIKNLY
jgi:glucan phosphoethanolaminetransferase (alkaline phosphatase superfamily)